ncbi:hypothetical protein C806_04195 [Lachnospiraceae bacterium 3-1]|nr:hypothetical protein C806_04195 [Lachnospiraceae bacterium 3-1]
MTIEELKGKGAIYFEQIKTGLTQYQNEIQVMDQEQAYEFFWKKWKEEYPWDTFVDFYYFSLPEEAKQKVNEVLTEEEREYLKQLFQREDSKGEIIFPMEEMLLGIVTKLNQGEILFSTIYFTGERGKRSAWWGNYKKEYVVFWEE